LQAFEQVEGASRRLIDKLSPADITDHEGAADLCVSEPKRVAQLLVDQGYSKRYDYALQALSEIRYDVWRDYDPEDTLRFYALRLHEAGLIKSSPNKLIAGHTDWRFLDELKRELKA
jgi:NitT/TauT family transport system substrate-binding protein